MNRTAYFTLILIVHVILGVFNNKIVSFQDRDKGTAWRETT